MPESILVQYMASFIYILQWRMGQQQEGRPSCFTLPPSYSKNDFTTRTIISESHLKSCLLFALPYKSISLLFLMGYTTRSKCSLEDFQDCITLFIVRYSTRLSFKNGICIENHLLHLFLRHFLNFVLAMPVVSLKLFIILMQVILKQVDPTQENPFFINHLILCLLQYIGYHQDK